MQIIQNNLIVPIEKVKPNEYNPKLDFRANDDNLKEYEKVKKSLQIAGQIQPIIVRELEDGNYEIINGYHRWEAMKELGYIEIEVKNLGKIDWDTAVSRALLTEDTKIPIDVIELAELMKKVVTPEKPAEYWANLLPYNAELIQAKIELLNFNFDQLGQDDGGEIDLANLSYTFKFSNETDLAKVKDYFEQFPKEGRGEALVKLLG